MDDRLVQLKGSASRDAFKQAHKAKLGKGYYACDIDFAIVEFQPAGIVAFFDYKKPRDSVSSTEVVVYNELVSTAPLYIVESPSPEDGPFKISLYINGELVGYGKPPRIDTRFVTTCSNWQQFKEFEDELRRGYRNGS